MGYRDVALVSILALFASPTAVSSFSMAIAMDADHELAAQIIMASTLMAMVTIFIWLTLFAQLNVL
jgi:predicted permease